MYLRDGRMAQPVALDVGVRLPDCFINAVKDRQEEVNSPGADENEGVEQRLLLIGPDAMGIDSTESDVDKIVEEREEAGTNIFVECLNRNHTADSQAHPFRHEENNTFEGLILLRIFLKPLNCVRYYRA